MAIQTVKTFATMGLEGFEVSVEADSNKALPTIEIIWLPDAAIKESKERLRAAFKNISIQLPPRKLIINLAPSDMKKVWTSFDFPIAVALYMLINDGVIVRDDIVSDALFLGEIGLDGALKWVNGILPAVLSALRKWYTRFFVPADNVYELAYIPNISVYPVSHLRDMFAFLQWEDTLSILDTGQSIEDLYTTTPAGNYVDFADIKWQLLAKRALAIAAAWMHNVLIIGSPWSGKTMLASALQWILPPLGYEEVLEVSQIYSIIGKLDKDQPLITDRPFRQVHHTASKVSIVWWGQQLRPGEISLAHRGILFFDELPEFPREVLEVLRQPLEDKYVSISRAIWSVQYPANFMFVSTMNPSPDGYYKDPEIECTNSLAEIKRYQSKISGPLMDRIDMILEIPREKVEKILDTEKQETSADVRTKVIDAWRKQEARFSWTAIVCNADISAKNIDKYIPLSGEVKDFLTQAAQKLHLSGRVVHRTMKLARTIADYMWSDDVMIQHIAEAMQYRSKTMFVDEV